MLTFDAAKATADYLAILPPEAHAKATAYTQGGHWVLLWGALISIAISMIIIRLGWLDGLQKSLEKSKPRPWVSSILVTGLFSLVSTIIGLPWAIYSGWYREKSYGMTSQPLSGWLSEFALSNTIGLVAMAVFLSLLYFLIRRTGKTWWAWAGLLTAGFMALMILMAPIYIEPLFNKYEDVPAGEVRTEIIKLANTNNIPSEKIYFYNGSKQSNRYTANVSGIGKSARIAISDTMMAKGADMAEIRGVVGHEMGHYAHQHSLWMVGIFSTLAMVMFFLVNASFAPTAKILGDKTTDIANPAGIATLSVIMSVIGLLGTPLTNTMIRTMESDADNYSLRIAHEPDGLAKALVKTIEYRAATPSDIEEIIFYDHPSVGRRVRNAMDWKAAHMSEIETPEADIPVAPVTEAIEASAVSSN